MLNCKKVNQKNIQETSISLENDFNKLVVISKEPIGNGMKNKFSSDSHIIIKPTKVKMFPLKLSRDHVHLSFVKEVMRDLRNCLWYWGALSAPRANRLLQTRLIGTFLVRDSHSEKCIFSLSYVTPAGVFHSRLARYNGFFCLGGPNALIRSSSLVDFIEQAVHSSKDNKRPLRILMHNSSMEPAAQQIEFSYPLCRTEFFSSLKYYCRLSIRNALAETGETVNSLPLPQKLKNYVNCNNYLLSN